MKKILFLLLFLPFVVQAQLELPFGIKVLNPEPLDALYYNVAGTVYTNTAQVISQVPASIRYRGQTFNVNGVEYWFSAGVADIDLVIKISNGFWPLTGTGALTGNVDITGGSGAYDTRIGTSASRLDEFRSYADNLIWLDVTNGGGTDLFAMVGSDIEMSVTSGSNINAFYLSQSSTQMYSTATGGSITVTTAPSSNNVLISSSRSGFKGATYNADYSANYTTRSLVDVGYVTTAIATAISPAGSNTEVQFNNSGAFGADADFTFDALNKRIIIGNALLGGTSTTTSLSTFGASTSLVIGSAGSISIQPTTQINIPLGIGNDNTATQILGRDGSNKMVYLDKSSITTLPAGSDTQMQYNNAGAFGAESALTYNSATNSILLANAAFTSSTTIFGGEIQLQTPASSDNITITNTSIIATGQSVFTIGNGSGDLLLQYNNSGAMTVVEFDGTSESMIFTPSSSISITTSIEGITAVSSTDHYDPFRITAHNGVGANNDGQGVGLTGGNGIVNGSGGDVFITPGAFAGAGKNGNLIITRIPTSSLGLPSGAVWSNAGILTIIP